MLELTHIDSFFDGWWTLLLKTKQRNHQFKQPKEYAKHDIENISYRTKAKNK
ncbi:MAG: hypothetical protein KHW87_01400 [Clostridiales bacterium]|nr:hypothetical protein [Clostridiales bacterium]